MKTFASFVIGIVATMVLLVPTAAAIDLKPRPIPGLEDYVSMFLGWVYWGVMVFCVFIVLLGVLYVHQKGEDKRSWIVIGLACLAFLLSLPKILEAMGI